MPSIKLLLQVSLSLLMGGIFASAIYYGTHPAVPSPSQPIIIYANQMKHDLKLTLCKAIAQAKETIFASYFGFTDQDVLAHIKKKAEHKIAIDVLYDPTSSAPIHLPQSARVTPIRRSGLMHRKILCIDGHTAYVGSANATPTSLRVHDNVLLGLYHPECARFLSSSQKEVGEFSLPDQKISCFFLPESGACALERLSSAIDCAQNTIRMALFTFTHQPLGEALIRAKRRGVKVQLALDATTARGASRLLAIALVEAGIEVRVSVGQELFHHKWVLIDDEEFIMGSANWTKAAFEKNEDLLIFLSPLKKEQQRFFNALWRRIENDTSKFALERNSLVYKVRS